MQNFVRRYHSLLSLIATLGIIACATTIVAQEATWPWMNKSLSPAERADLVLKQMTLEEKLALLHGNGMANNPSWTMPLTPFTNGGAGYVEGVKRLGIPPLVISDAAYGIRHSGVNGRYATALPSNLGAASAWDPQSACEYGEVIGSELRAQGFNMTLGGGVNLTREPRNGRTFEYAGEDPLLAGTLVGNMMKCEQAQHVVGDIKHYVMNDQETGRFVVNVTISKRAMQESDLLAISHRNHDCGSWRGDVLLQPDQQRLRLRERVHANGRTQEGLGIQGLRGLRLGRNPQHEKSVCSRS